MIPSLLKDGSIYQVTTTMALFISAAVAWFLSRKGVISGDKREKQLTNRRSSRPSPRKVLPSWFGTFGGHTLLLMDPAKVSNCFLPYSLHLVCSAIDHVGGRRVVPQRQRIISVLLIISIIALPIWTHRYHLMSSFAGYQLFLLICLALHSYCSYVFALECCLVDRVSVTVSLALFVPAL